MDNIFKLQYEIEQYANLTLFFRSANRLADHARVVKVSASVDDSSQLEVAVKDAIWYVDW